MGMAVVMRRGVWERITVTRGRVVRRCMRVVIGMWEEELSMGRMVKWRRKVIRPRGSKVRRGCEEWRFR